jgi:hypothetical protein
MTKIVAKVADLQISAVNGVTFSFDKTPRSFEHRGAYRKARRAYFHQAYKAFREKFYDKVNDLVKEMNAAIPQEVKDNNVKA